MTTPRQSTPGAPVGDGKSTTRITIPLADLLAEERVLLIEVDGSIVAYGIGRPGN